MKIMTRSSLRSYRANYTRLKKALAKAQEELETLKGSDAEVSIQFSRLEDLAKQLSEIQHILGGQKDIVEKALGA